MVKNFLDLVKIADEYNVYLKSKGMKFKTDGFPIFERSMFLNQIPELILPYDFRNSCLVKDSQKVLLCFYCADSRIYPRLEKIHKEILEYKKYAGVVAADVTVSSDMDKEWQDFIMLLNQLFMGVLAVNGVKVVANLRTGSFDSQKNFSGVPQNVMWAAGFLGCTKDNPYDMRFISSVVEQKPSMLFIYGKKDDAAVEKLNWMGVKYRICPDYHRMRKGVRSV